jgi:hypothetical protein
MTRSCQLVSGNWPSDINFPVSFCRRIISTNFIQESEHCSCAAIWNDQMDTMTNLIKNLEVRMPQLLFPDFWAKK